MPAREASDERASDPANERFQSSLDATFICFHYTLRVCCRWPCSRAVDTLLSLSFSRSLFLVQAKASHKGALRTCSGRSSCAWAESADASAANRHRDLEQCAGEKHEKFQCARECVCVFLFSSECRMCCMPLHASFLFLVQLGGVMERRKKDAEEWIQITLSDG